MGWKIGSSVAHGISLCSERPIYYLTPKSVRTRVDKMGVPVPTLKWFAHDLYGKPKQDIPAT
jgi:hypothetical protein